MIASSDIDQRLPASGTWLAPVIKVVTALNPTFSSASGLLKRGGKAMPGVYQSLRYVILVLRLRFDGKCKSFGGQLWQDEFYGPTCFPNMTSFNISPSDLSSLAIITGGGSVSQLPSSSLNMGLTLSL